MIFMLAVKVRCLWWTQLSFNIICYERFNLVFLYFMLVKGCICDIFASLFLA